MATDYGSRINYGHQPVKPDFKRRKANREEIRARLKKKGFTQSSLDADAPLEEEVAEGEAMVREMADQIRNARKRRKP
jgi:hypothetical protein